MTASETGDLLGSRTVLLETRKRDGTWVGTPVNLATGDGHVYFRTWGTSGKAKRLRNFPEVRLAPSTMRGKPTGSAVNARARLLADDEEPQAKRALAGRFPVAHGFVVPLFHRARKWKTVHFEVTFTE